MKFVADILYLEFEELTALGISDRLIWQGIYRKSKSWQAITDPADGRRRLIRYETLRPKYKTLVEARYGNPYQWLAAQQRQATWSAIERQVAAADTRSARETARAKRRADGSRLYSDGEIEAVAGAAAWLQWLAPIKGADARALGYGGKTELLEACLVYWQERETPILSNYSNSSYLRRRLNAFARKGAEVLCSGKKANGNARKIDEAARRYLLQLYSIHTKLSTAQVHRRYNAHAATTAGELKTLSLSAVRRLLAEPENAVLACAARHGKKALRDRFEPTINRRRPDRPHQLWVMDGSPMELFYNDGQARYPKRVYAFLVIDAHSWAVVGAAFGQSETQALVFDALRDAARRTGVLAEQLQFDNASAIKSHDMMEWYERAFRRAYPARVGNAKAKVIEPVMKHLNEQVLRLYNNYAGAGITARRLDNRVNDEWIARHFAQLPDRAGVTAQLEEALFDRWNARPVEAFGDSPANLLAATANEQARRLDTDDMISLFWKFRMSGDRRRQYTYTKEGLTVTIAKTKHRYEVRGADDLPDLAFWRANAGRQFAVRYDPDELGMIALYDGDRQVALAETAYRAPMAVAGYEEGDAGMIRRRIAQRDRYFDEVAEEAEAMRLGQTLAPFDAESYVKAPLPVAGKQKDCLNAAKATVRRRRGLFDRPATFRPVEDT